MPVRSVIAVDLGAESGRVMRAEFDGARLTLDEAHRFPNVPGRVRGVLYWDALRLWNDISEGIGRVQGASSVGVDTWGVDYALLDRHGNLLNNPRHHRNRTVADMERVFERVGRRFVFDRTGIQLMPINALYELAALTEQNDPALEAAETFLTIADLFNYWLSGSPTCEFSQATTTQTFNPLAMDWDADLLAPLGIPVRMFPEVVIPGTRVGVYEGMDVIVPACHDTGSAVVGTPATSENFAYLSSGTWSLFGLELTEPIISDASYEANLTNEGGAYGTFRMLKNVMGLWLAQQCRATWAAEGRNYSYDELVWLASEAQPFHALFDPDAPEMLPPGDMPERIREFCRRTSQPAPETVGQVMRAVYESLALKYRLSLDNLRAVSSKSVDRLHVIGGGSQNALLCQMTADACGCEVVAGPTEATALGNAIVQLIALGELGGLGDARAMLARTVETVTYTPKDQARWEEKVSWYKTLPLNI